MCISNRRGWRALLAFVSLVAVAGAVTSSASVALAQQQEETEEMRQVRAAEQLVQQRRPDDALAIVRELLDKNREYAPAYFVGGLAYEAKNQHREAYEYFVKAAEYQPGWGLAHRKASANAADIGDLEASWDQAILAHQAGTDMSDAFAGLQTMSKAPDDLQARLSAMRVFVAPMNLEKFLAHYENPFGRMIDAGGSATDTNNLSNTKATGVGARIVSESSADRATVMRIMRNRLADSRYFGLVGRQDLGQSILVLEVEDIGENMANRPLEGHLRLLDAQSGEELYRYRVEMRNIVSQSDVTRDMDRIIGLLEEWAARRVR